MLRLLVFAAAIAAPLLDRPASLVGPPVYQSSYKARLRDEALRAEAFYSLHSVCRSGAISDVETRSLGGAPPVFLERLKFAGCGRTGLMNLQVRPNVPGRWTVAFRLPGLSYADAQLQQNAVTHVIGTLADHAPQGCLQPNVGLNVAVGETSIAGDHGSIRVVLPGGKPKPTAANVRFTTTLTLGDPKLVADVDEDRAWREIWPLRACGVDRSVSVTFLPHKSRPAFYEILVSPHWAGAPGFHTTPEAPRSLRGRR
jgi:hypothetical protein